MNFQAGKTEPLYLHEGSKTKFVPADPGGADQLRTPPEPIPPHPTHNRKEITAFVVVVLVSTTAWYGLSRVPRWEMLSLYVFGLGPLLGLLAIKLFMTVRCPRCRLAIPRIFKREIAGRKWAVFRCKHCHGKWRLEADR